MFAVRIELLGGTYRASRFDDRRQCEWPPHPARLFYAAVAAVYDEMSTPGLERDALVWWEGLGAPNLHLAPGGTVDLQSSWLDRSTVDHYVPGNHASSWARDIQGDWQVIADLEAAVAAARAAASAGDMAAADRALDRARTKLANSVGQFSVAASRDTARQALTVTELLPDNRNRQPRQFPAVVPDHPVIFLSWPDANPGKHSETLDRVLSRVARLGHSASVVSCAVVDSVPPPSLVPTDAGGTALRTVASGVLDVLEEDFVRHQGNSPRVLPAIITSYGSPHSTRAAVPHSTNDAEWVVLTLPKGEKLLASRTLDLCVAVRAAILSHCAEPVPPFISGHEPGAAPTPPTVAPHISAIPLIDATHSRSDGAIHGVAVVIPTGASGGDRQTLTAALAQWRTAGDGSFPLTLPGGTLRRFDSARASSSTGLRRNHGVIDRSFWSRQSSEWATVTPMALDRYPKAPPGTDEYMNQTTDLVRRACRDIGLPHPLDVSCSTISTWAAAPPVASGGRRRRGTLSRGFPPYRLRAGSNRHTVHVRIRFGETVGGPLVLGAGRFFGYGLMFPVLSGEWAAP